MRAVAKLAGQRVRVVLDAVFLAGERVEQFAAGGHEGLELLARAVLRPGGLRKGLAAEAGEQRESKVRKRFSVA